MNWRFCSPSCSLTNVGSCIFLLGSARRTRLWCYLFACMEVSPLYSFPSCSTKKLFSLSVAADWTLMQKQCNVAASELQARWQSVVSRLRDHVMPSGPTQPHQFQQQQLQQKQQLQQQFQHQQLQQQQLQQQLQQQHHQLHQQHQQIQQFKMQQLQQLPAADSFTSKGRLSQLADSRPNSRPDPLLTSSSSLGRLPSASSHSLLGSLSSHPLRTDLRPEIKDWTPPDRIPS